MECREDELVLVASLRRTHEVEKIAVARPCALAKNSIPFQVGDHSPVVLVLYGTGKL
jgi:hypothetical protein